MNDLTKYLSEAILNDIQTYEGPHTAASISSLYTTREIDLDNNQAYDEPIVAPEKIETVMRELEKDGLVLGYHDTYAKSRYEISDKGADMITDLFPDEETVIHRYRKFGEDWLKEVLLNIIAASENNTMSDQQNSDEGNLAQTADIPAAGRLVNLSDNAEKFGEFKSDLSELIEALDDQDHTNNLSDEESTVIRGQLESAKRLIEASPVVTEAALKTVLLVPIKFLVDRVTAGIIGAKAAAIFDFLISFL